MSLYNQLILKLTSQGIQKDIIDKLIEEYKIVKLESLKRDEEKVSLHSSKFSDIVLALVKN